MFRFRIRYLLFSLALFTGCSSFYKSFQPAAVDPECIEKLKPQGLVTAWYNTAIDVMGRHISGLLLIKNMPEGSTRIVFTNEAGLKFLDFEFLRNSDFKVHYIIKQLDKKPVIRLLRKDFALLLGLPFASGTWKAWQSTEAVLYGVTEKEDKYYFITDKDCASLQRVESGTKRKRMVSLKLFGEKLRQPDSIQLTHHTFNMQIRLRKIDRE